MKKSFAAFFALVLGVSSLFADEVADVKAVLLRQCELVAAGDFSGAGLSLAPDYVEITPLGVFDRTQIRWAYEAWDGRHPEEYMLTACAQQTKGYGPDAAMEKEARIAAHKPEFIKLYEGQIAEFVPRLKASAALALKTARFIDIKIEGDSARVIYEYDTIDLVDGKVRHQAAIAVLRRIDGKWLVAQNTCVTY